MLVEMRLNKDKPNESFLWVGVYLLLPNDHWTAQDSPLRNVTNNC